MSEKYQPVDDRRNRTYFEFWQENGSWHATEPAGSSDLIGRGQSPMAAVAHYCRLVEDTAGKVTPEVPADD